MLTTTINMKAITASCSSVQTRRLVHRSMWIELPFSDGRENKLTTFSEFYFTLHLLNRLLDPCQGGSVSIMFTQKRSIDQGSRVQDILVRGSTHDEIYNSPRSINNKLLLSTLCWQRLDSPIVRTGFDVRLLQPLFTDRIINIITLLILLFLD